MMIKRLALVAALALVVTACGDDDSGTSVDNAWARPSATMQNAGAVYLEITGGSEADSLLGVSVSADIAAGAGLHETVMVDGDMGDDMGATSTTGHDMGDMGGAMTMQPVASIPIPADGDVVLEPGGFHVMLMDLVAPLEDGDTFELTLQFESGDQTVSVEVRDG